MLLKTKFSQLAASEQCTVLWSSKHFKCFLKSWQDKVSPPLSPLNCETETIFFLSQAFLHQDQAVGWKEPHESAWEWEYGDGCADAADGAALARVSLLLPGSLLGQPALGQAKPKQQEEWLHNGSWTCYGIKVQREPSPCAFLVTTVGRRTPSIPPFGIK